MNKSKKILVLLLTLIMNFSFAVPCFAAESVNNSVTTAITFSAVVNSTGSVIEKGDWSVSFDTVYISHSSDEFVVLANNKPNQTYPGSFYVYIVNKLSGSITNYYIESITRTFVSPSGSISSQSVNRSFTLPEYSHSSITLKSYNCNIPVFFIPSGQYLDANYTYSDIFNGVIVPDNGVRSWDISNHYSYTSIYSTSVVSPDIRYAYMYHQKEVKYQNGDVSPEDYGFYCLFRTDTDIINDYYTEVWVEGPFNYQGELITKKVCVGVYKTFDLSKSLDMNYSTSTGSGMDTEHYGSCYELKISWNNTLSSYFDFDYFKSNGGGKVFLRNHVKRSDTDVYTSMYSWFNINPNDIKDIEGGSVTSRPVIHNFVGSDLNESGVADVSGSTSSPNAYDYDYIAGNTVEPSKNIVNDGAMPEDSHQYDSDYISTSGGTYLPDVNNIDGFADYVSTGFGLLGSRGLIACLKSVLTLLPEEIFVYLTWFVCIGIALALLCLLFKK